MPRFRFLLSTHVEVEAEDEADARTQLEIAAEAMAEAWDYDGEEYTCRISTPSRTPLEMAFTVEEAAAARLDP